MRLATLLLATCTPAACHGGNERVVHAVLPAARGLRDGAVVRYRGIEVGKVVAMRIFERSGIFDSAVVTRKHADSLHPAGTRSHQ